MIKLNDVSYRYNGAAVQAIQHVSLFIKKGELVVITGKSRKKRLRKNNIVPLYERTVPAFL